MHLTDKTAFPFEIIPNDPMQVHTCKLANGLTLYFSVNKDEPRICTEIAVRAGSKHDPAESTGLAHYFEHMMFKGTDRIGTLDWEAEKVILDQIEELYEKHRKTTDPQEKSAIYLEIDTLSSKAATFATANEYDKLLGAMGAKGTNAYTWVEQTVYLNDIPTNELERWFKVESERFRRPVLRLFHTELETVFEEFNISQDKDFRKVSKAIFEKLLPTHPYGTQTTLGKGEHLKSPSQKDIYQFFDKYYVPNNMAITLCGDFDPNDALQLAEKYFGHYEAKPVPPFSFEQQPELTERTEVIVHGEEAEWVELAWRLPGAGHKDHAALTLLSLVLYNEVAGLIDTNLVHDQKLLTAYAYIRSHEDYSVLILYGKPREGQTLEEVEQLLLDQIHLVQYGKFDSWLLEGSAKLFKVEEFKRLKSNKHRASAITMMFVLGRPWHEMVNFLETITNCTSADVVEVAQKYLSKDNYVTAKKRQGKDTQVMKVEKPPITPIQVNRDELSMFAKHIFEEDTDDISPEWPEYSKLIKTKMLAPLVKLHTVRDEHTQLGTLEWIWPVGNLYDIRLPLLKSYLSYLGTDTKSSGQIKQALFRLGVSMDVRVSDQHTVLHLNGLDASLPEAVALVNDLMRNVQPDADVLENLKADIRTSRENNKKNKDYILRNGMKPYAMHGPDAKKRLVIPTEDLDKLDAQALVQLLHDVVGLGHDLHYYGPRRQSDIFQVLKTQYQPAAQIKKAPKVKKLRELEQKSTKVFFVHFPMVQVEMLQVSKGTPKLNRDEYVMERWFNNYFGTSMSSVVFQEIREARAMAYQTYAMSASPATKDHAHYFYTFVGTQPDKMAEAISVMSSLTEEMPVNADLVEQARQNTIKVLNASRVPLSSVYWRKYNNQLAGWKDEPLKMVLDFTEKASLKDLTDYHAKYIKGRRSTWLILGDRAHIDFKALRKLGKVKELSVEEVLGY